MKGSKSLKYFKFDEFFKLDFEYQKYMYVNDHVSKIQSDIKVVDNDEMFAMFLNEKRLCFTKTHFFIRSNNKAYIVYDKVTKKVRSNASKNYYLSEAFLKYFFSTEVIYSHINYPKNLSNTFIKRVVENKINTIKDFLNYEKSYILRNKNIPDEVLLNFSVISKQGFSLGRIAPFIKNWDLFLNIENCHKLKIIDVEDLKCINYEINTQEDLNPFKINREYENWQDKIALQLN
jgi:hypothetical protein